MPSPIPVAVGLSDGEREQLEAWARRGKSAQALAQRSRIVLAAAEGLNNRVSGRFGGELLGRVRRIARGRWGSPAVVAARELRGL